MGAVKVNGFTLGPTSSSWSPTENYIDDLMDAGLSSLKIEGRAKSAYYAAVVTGAYRHAIDSAMAGEPLDPVWREEVERVSRRAGTARCS